MEALIDYLLRNQPDGKLQPNGYMIVTVTYNKGNFLYKLTLCGCGITTILISLCNIEDTSWVCLQFYPIAFPR